jgi:hypothetical protein
MHNGEDGNLGHFLAFRRDIATHVAPEPINTYLNDASASRAYLRSCCKQCQGEAEVVNRTGLLTTPTLPPTHVLTHL